MPSTTPVTCDLDLGALRAVAAPLYERYAGQSEPQDAYIELDCEERTYTAESNPEIGNAVPSRVGHGHVRRYPLPEPRITGQALATLLEDPELIALLTRVCDGYESVWNGNNHVARLDDDATAADEALDAWCQDHGTCDREEDVAWDAEAYVANSDWVAIWPPQMSATEAEAEAGVPDDVQISGSISEELLDEAKRRFANPNYRDDLSIWHMDSLLEDGRITAEQYWAWIADMIDDCADELDEDQADLEADLHDLADALRE